VKYPDGPVVVLGASYARGWEPDSIADALVINAGVSGQQSFELLERFAVDVASHKPRAVLIWGFINDFFRSSRDRVEQTRQRVKESFERLVVTARASGIEPVLLTEVTVRHPDTLMENLTNAVARALGRSGYQDYINAEVLGMNEWLRGFAAREQVLLIDTHPVLADASGRRRRAYAQPDGSHISAAGYEALSRYALPILQAHFQKPHQE
jgi:lysophospholipase L1-like esterase